MRSPNFFGRARELGAGGSRQISRVVDMIRFARLAHFRASLCNGAIPRRGMAVHDAVHHVQHLQVFGAVCDTFCGRDSEGLVVTTEASGMLVRLVDEKRASTPDQQ